MREVQVYEAFDGVRFAAREECEAYEREHRPAWWALVGLTEEQIKQAFDSPIDNPLAAEIITLGYSLSATRRAAAKVAGNAAASASVASEWKAATAEAAPTAPSGNIVNAGATLTKAGLRENAQ